MAYHSLLRLPADAATMFYPLRPISCKAHCPGAHPAALATAPGTPCRRSQRLAPLCALSILIIAHVRGIITLHNRPPLHRRTNRMICAVRTALSGMFNPRDAHCARRPSSIARTMRHAKRTPPALQHQARRTAPIPQGPGFIPRAQRQPRGSRAAHHQRARTAHDLLYTAGGPRLPRTSAP